MSRKRSPQVAAVAEPAQRARKSQHDERADRQDANRAVAVSAVGLAITGGVELALAIFTGSVALLGDALHNLSDVSTSAVVFLGFRVSKRPATTTYPYGFERAEDLAGLGVALVIWLSAAFAGFESYRKLVGGEGTNHLGIGMAGAALGIIGNQVVARYKAVVGKRIQSVTLQADAKHSWLDALSSLGALIGLGVVATGRTWGDPIAGFAVTLFILHVGWEVTGEVLHHLMDGVDHDDIDTAPEAACQVDGVESVRVRGRWMGRSLLIEIEGNVAAGTTIEEATAIGEEVGDRVHQAVPSARDVRFVPVLRRDWISTSFGNENGPPACAGDLPEGTGALGYAACRRPVEVSAVTVAPDDLRHATSS